MIDSSELNVTNGDRISPDGDAEQHNHDTPFHAEETPLERAEREEREERAEREEREEREAREIEALAHQWQTRRADTVVEEKDSQGLLSHNDPSDAPPDNSWTHRMMRFMERYPLLPRALFFLSLAIIAGGAVGATALSLDLATAIAAGTTMGLTVGITTLLLYPLYQLGKQYMNWLAETVVAYDDAVDEEESFWQKARIAAPVLLSFIVLSAAIFVPITLQFLGVYPLFSELLWPGLLSVIEMVGLTSGGAMASLEGLIIGASVGAMVVAAGRAGLWFEAKYAGVPPKSEVAKEPDADPRTPVKGRQMDPLLTPKTVHSLVKQQAEGAPKTPSTPARLFHPPVDPDGVMRKDLVLGKDGRFRPPEQADDAKRALDFSENRGDGHTPSGLNNSST